MTLRRTLRAVLLAGTALSGCEAIRDADQSIAGISSGAGDRAERLRAAKEGGVYREATPYFGEAVVAETGSVSGKPLPKALEGARGFSASVSGASISDVAKLITDRAGIPVNVRTRYTLPDGQMVEIPIGGRLTASHEGSLSKFLEIVAARMDVAWSYDGTAITFDRMETRTYSVPLPSGTSNFETTMSGISGNGSTRSASLSRSSAQDPWADIEAQLAPITPSPASTTFARNLGRVTVFGPPSVQKKAALIIDDFHKVYSTRIALEVAVFFVDAEKSDNIETNLSLSGTDGSFTGVAGALTGNGVATLSRGDVTVNFRALAKDASVVDYRMGSTVAQSGVVSPIVLTRAQNYVSKTTTTTSDGTTSTSIETATVDTGVSIHALPRLIDNRRIQLSLTIFQNDLTNLQTFNAGTSTVQLPTIDQRALQNDSVLTPGETLVLSGYEQEVASRSNAGTGAARFLGLGGSAKGSTRKIRMIVLVRPTLMPVGAAP
jgi:type IVB pilus formation R64 PilN family outer membrane protein